MDVERPSNRRCNRRINKVDQASIRAAAAATAASVTIASPASDAASDAAAAAAAAQPSRSPVVLGRSRRAKTDVACVTRDGIRLIVAFVNDFHILLVYSGGRRRVSLGPRHPSSSVRAAPCHAT